MIAASGQPAITSGRAGCSPRPQRASDCSRRWPVAQCAHKSTEVGPVGHRLTAKAPPAEQRAVRDAPTGDASAHPIRCMGLRNTGPLSIVMSSGESRVAGGGGGATGVRPLQSIYEGRRPKQGLLHTPPDAGADRRSEGRAQLLAARCAGGHRRRPGRRRHLRVRRRHGAVPLLHRHAHALGTRRNASLSVRRPAGLPPRQDTPQCI
jgi:hypothetical protein